MGQATLFYRFGAALAIGILVGLQREYAYGGSDKELFAGVRTFALISLLGCTGGVMADELGTPWGLIGLLIPMGALIVVAHLVSAWQRGGVGLTTEIAALLTFSAGALCYWEYLALAAAVGVLTTVLLSVKPEMHAFAQRITREDIYATLKFAVITVVVLPVLPNTGYGPPPLDVVNPYEIWLMVVLISAISFLAYVLIKLIGPRQGISLTGVLGGMMASTPLTLSFSRRSHDEEELCRPLAMAISVAWAMTFVRVLVEVAALNTELLSKVWLPLISSSVVGFAYGAYLHVAKPGLDEEEIEFSNPFELGTALRFGLLYAVVLTVSKAAEVYVGDAGVYVTSFLSGLQGVNAVTLSLARLSGFDGGLSLITGARGVVIAVMANTLAKGGIVLSIGSQELRRAILPAVGLMVATGVGVAVFM